MVTFIGEEKEQTPRGGHKREVDAAVSGGASHNVLRYAIL